MLEVRDLSVRFGGRTALDGISASFAPGRITGVIGPNGAGKSTLFNVVTGFQTPDEGSVRHGTVDITNWSPHRRARLGIARTFQRLELFGSLTVRENIAVAVRRTHHRDRRPQQFCEETIERFGLEGVADTPAGVLPVGIGRVVELARAVATRPHTLLLDEPASGLDEVETRLFDTAMRGLAASGLALGIVEHDIALVMSVCDVIYVLDRGRVICCGSPESVQSNVDVQTAYLGGVA
jgi:branched-chain amino acid transport system ATP-binding protein